MRLPKGLAFLFGPKNHIRLISNKTSVEMVSHNKVRVKQGVVVGGNASLPNGLPYKYFKGISYAVPPIGELRFQAPVPLKSFSKPEIDCTAEGAICFQKDAFTGELCGSEDCLFLNVYAPQTKDNTLLPVMVFIHGGGYRFGSGNSDLYNPLYLLQEDVIVVTFNYRLGALGFLSLPEANISGNAGLKDQHLALQWVKDNIIHFNGNPDNITLFGESSGGSSAHLHFLSGRSRKLFNKLILQSGTANMQWVIKTNLSEKSILLAKAIGCQSNNHKEIAAFLQAHTEIDDFLKHANVVMKPEERRQGLPMPFVPTIEKDSPGALVTRDILESTSKINNIDIPVMMGYNSGEGLVMLASAITKLETYERDLARLIPRNLIIQPGDPDIKAITEEIRNFYLAGAKVDKKTLNNLQEILADYNFNIATYIAAENHSRNFSKSPLYFYRFDYEGGLGFYKRIFGFDHLKGTCHADELFYLFQSTLNSEPWADRDEKMVKRMCKLWTNFAKYSNPTPSLDDSHLINCLWEPVQKVKNNEEFVLNAFIIDEKQKMIENPNRERIKFWKNIFKKYKKHVRSNL